MTLHIRRNNAINVSPTTKYMKLIIAFIFFYVFMDGFIPFTMFMYVTHYRWDWVGVGLICLLWVMSLLGTYLTYELRRTRLQSEWDRDEILRMKAGGQPR